MKITTIRKHLYVLLVMVVAGCSPHEMTIDEEIARLPDKWSDSSTFGASSNNWAVLDKIAKVEDIQERVRLTIAIQQHFRRSPELILAAAEVDKDLSMRMGFYKSCAYQLIEDRSNDPIVASAGWELLAAWLEDIERLIDLTEKDWNNGVYNRFASEAARRSWGWASRIRTEYERYFRYSFSICLGTYRRLSESARPAFVEQIKRDFFHRPGMKYVDLSKFPPEFK